MGLQSIDHSQKVWVGNLPSDATVEELEVHFKQLGDPTGVEVVRRGVGCVAYRTKEEADVAIAAFNASELRGSVIQTEPWGKKVAGGKGGGIGMTPCKFFAQGICNKGAECTFSHDATAKGGYKGGGKWSGSLGWSAPDPYYGMKGGYKGYGGGYGDGYGGLDPYTVAVVKGGWAKGGWGGDDGWGKDGGKGKSKSEGSYYSGKVKILSVSVPPGSSLTTQGYPAEAPAIAYDKDAAVFGAANPILRELVENADVTCEHDPDWQLYPEVAESVKAVAGEDHCVAVFKCQSRGKWGVGLGSGWKGREMSGKLALAIALCDGDKDVIEKISLNFRDFGRLCKSNGLIESYPSRKGKGKGEAEDGVEKVWFREVPPVVHSLKLPPSSKLVKQGLPKEALAVYWDKEKHRSFYSNAIGILGEILTDPATEVKFEDDADWKVYPEVGEALKAAGGEEDCYCIASCPTHKVWGVGVASGWKSREPAARLALCLALTQATGRAEEFAQKPEYYHFGLYAGSLGLAQAPPKRARLDKAAEA